MDPRAMTAQDWLLIPPMLISLYSFVGCMVAFAFNLMLYTAVIPSLVGTRHLPARAESFRPAFLGLAVVFFALAVGIFLNFALYQTGVIYDIYPNRWI